MTCEGFGVGWYRAACMNQGLQNYTVIRGLGKRLSFQSIISEGICKSRGRAKNTGISQVEEFQK